MSENKPSLTGEVTHCRNIDNKNIRGQYRFKETELTSREVYNWNRIFNNTAAIFYGNTYNPLGGATISNSGNSIDPDPPTQPSGEVLAELKDQVKKLTDDNTQLWDAVREIVAENNQLKDKLNELLKALGAKESNGPIVSNPGHYRATGYYQEG